jgi:hypothetical protein
MAKKTYFGSCHCGNVRFECEINLAQADAFRLLQGKGELSDYQFGSEIIHHLFCRTCGVKLLGRGSMEELGGEFYAINVASLDNATDEELAEAPIRYEDGRNNNWESPPTETRHL